MKYKPAPFGLYAIDEKTGHYKPVKLTQVLPDRELAIVPHKDDVTYGQAISQAFAKNRFNEEMK